MPADRTPIFVSYSSRNSQAVDKLVSTLKKWGYRVWRDQYDIRPGDAWKQSIIESLRRSSVLLLVVSKAAVESKIVEWELDTASRLGIRVIPVMLEQTPLPMRLARKLNRLQRVSLTHGRDRGFARLVDALGGIDGLVPKLPGDIRIPQIRANALLIVESIRFLQEIVDGGAVIYTGGPGNSYVQLLVSGEPTIYGEAAGNAHLDPAHRLNAIKLEALQEYGWEPPDKKSASNFRKEWMCISDQDRAFIAGEIMQTFSNIYGHCAGDRLGVEMHLD